MNDGETNKGDDMSTTTPESTYFLRDDQGDDHPDTYATIGEAREAARDLSLSADFDDPDSTVWDDIHIVDCADGEVIETVTTAVHPPEPECVDDGEHDWRSPIALVGGCNENPGVYGSGGGVMIAEVCVRCGCERIEDTWAQRPDTGEQGLTSMEYREEAHDIEAHLVAMVEGAEYDEEEIAGGVELLTPYAPFDGWRGVRVRGDDEVEWLLDAVEARDAAEFAAEAIR